MGFLGMILEDTGIRGSQSKLNSVADMPAPTEMEKLRSFIGMTGYLRNFVTNKSNISTPPTNLLRSKAFASKPVHKSIFE